MLIKTPFRNPVPPPTLDSIVNARKAKRSQNAEEKKKIGNSPVGHCPDKAKRRTNFLPCLLMLMLMLILSEYVIHPAREQ